MSDPKDAPTKWGGKREKFIVDELLTRQVASLLASGSTPTQIAQVLGISRTLASKICLLPSTKSFLKEVGESSLAEAKLTIRTRVSRLANKILDVIEAKLDEGELDAVKVGLKVLGLDVAEPPSSTGTSLTVVLPGHAPAPKPIEAEFSDVAPEGEENERD